MSLNGAAMFIAMVIIIILFEIILTITKGSAGMSFITPTNLFSILRQQAYTGIIAFGLTLVMITGNIDLSVGSMLTFLCCVCAKIMMGTDNGLLGIFGTIAAGAICGLVNGVLVSYVKLNSFITTLGTSSIFTALALRISSGTVLVIPDNCDPLFQAIGITSFGPVHILIVWFVIVAVVLGLLLSRTVYGQQLYTIGSNPVAARFSGIRAKRNTTVSYVITGLCVGLAAVLMMANVKSSNPQASNGKEMEIILAVVLGGVSVTGGNSTLSLIISIVAALITGALTGLLNGFVVAKIGVSPLIATIATNYLFKGLVFNFAQSSFAPTDADAVKVIAKTKLFGLRWLTPSVIIFVVIVILLGLWMYKTKFGNRLHVVGDNPEAASYSGISVSKTVLITYILCGVLAAVSGFLMVSFDGYTIYTQGNSLSTFPISCCVIGGIKMAGGKGTVVHMLLGVLIMRAISTMMSVMFLSTDMINLITGILLVAVLIIDRFTSTKSADE